MIRMSFIKRYQQSMTEQITKKYGKEISLIAGTTVLVVLGCLYTFGAIVPYASSYLHYQGSHRSTSQYSLVFTLAIVMINVGMPVGAYAHGRISNRAICFISTSILSFSTFIASFVTNFILFMIFYGILIGFAIGLGYIAPVRNGYTHFPDRKGFCAGICISGFGFGSILFNYIIVLLINPQNKKIDHETHLFSPQIANNFPYTLRVLSLIYFFMGALASIFIFPNDKKQILIEMSNLSQRQPQINPQQNRSKLFFKKNGHWLILNLICIVPFGFFVAANYKQIGFQNNEKLQSEDHFLTFTGSIGIFANGFSRAVWGTLFDRYSFRKIMIIMNVVLLAGSSLILTAVQNKWTYFLIIPPIYFCFGGTFGIMPTQTVRIFGEKLGGDIYWPVYIGFTIASLLQFFIHSICVSLYGQEEAYSYSMMAFVVLEILGLIITVKIDYEYVLQK